MGYQKAHYESKDSEGNDLIQRDIVAHQHKHSTEKDGHGMSVGHYPLMKDSGYYQEKTISFAEKISNLNSFDDIEDLKDDVSEYLQELIDSCDFSTEDEFALKVVNVFNSLHNYSD